MSLHYWQKSIQLSPVLEVHSSIGSMHELWLMKKTSHYSLDVDFALFHSYSTCKRFSFSRKPSIWSSLFINIRYLYIIDRRTDSEERLSAAEHVNTNSLPVSLPNNVLTQDADLPGSFLSPLSLNNSHCLSQNQNEITTRANSYSSINERDALAWDCQLWYTKYIYLFIYLFK